MDLLELFQHSARCLSHVGAVGFHIVDQFDHFACLALHLMHHAVHFQGINTQQAHSVAEKYVSQQLIGTRLKCAHKKVCFYHTPISDLIRSESDHKFCLMHNSGSSSPIIGESHTKNSWSKKIFACRHKQQISIYLILIF